MKKAFKFVKYDDDRDMRDDMDEADKMMFREDDDYNIL